ncbi:hypothetical protein JXA31_06145 [Candidatus Bathyarchaeota archaeon]|nr:hypothetical protein [Candidatus Bathyarchaeota archaeon]
MPKEIVSVEKVLNSRCSSDVEGGSKKRHWGTFKNVQPSQEMLKSIINCCKVPQYSDGKLEFWFKDNYLFLGFKKQKDPFKERMLHVESGMQHEAVYLSCAALGVGTCIHNQGINGTDYEDKTATASFLIMEIVDSYETGQFTTKAPGPEKPFMVGKNLGAPVRDSEVECLPELERLTLYYRSGVSAQEKEISQLLWAAKGRTPHYVGSSPWGLTIPTWAHGQGYTDVYLVKDGKLFRYVNWTEVYPLNKPLKRGLRYLKWRLYGDSEVHIMGNPTHDVSFLRNVNLASQLDGADAGIILCRNEQTGRALWEVGYMLENLFLQAKSLGVSYGSKFFSGDEISELGKMGVADAVAAFLL